MNTAINYSVFETFPTLHSSRLTYRAFRDSDAKAVYALRSNAKVMEFMDTALAESIEQGADIVATNQNAFKKKEGLVWALADKESDAMIGYCGFWRLIPNACRGEIGYTLLPELWGKGLMTEAMDTILAFTFQHLQLHSIMANINPQNQRSEKLLQKFGFQKDAHFREDFLFQGKFLDSIIYTLLEQDFLFAK
jgi:ribosomal-protein-alanine N-acetyltransferase